MIAKESQNIEWKQSWRDEYLKWICGFANADGGILEIGRDDSGAVVGVKHASKLLEDIPNKVRDILGIIVGVNLCSEHEKEYIQIVVEPYPYPISYKGEYHYRSGSTKQELKGASLDKFLLRKQGLHWDGVPVPDFSVQDLSKQALATFRQRASMSKRLNSAILSETDEVLIKKLRLYNNNYLKRAAILLFHEDPEVLVGGAYIKIGFFQTNTNLLYQDEVHGDLFTQVEKALDLLLTKYLKAWIRYEGLQRIEEYPIPETALREALVNAVAHKNYASAIPIQISVYDHALMIWNPGQLPETWSVDKLFAKHESQPYNPDIANAFFRTALMESWGRGYEKIFEACEQRNLPLPKVEYEPTGLWIKFSFSEMSAKTPETRVETPETRVETPETRVETLETRVETPEAILGQLRSQPALTLAEVATKIGRSVSTVERATQKLKKQGRLQYIGPKKNGHWEVIDQDENLPGISG